MERVYLVGMIGICFVAYGLIPFIASLFLAVYSKDESLGILLSLIWGMAVLVQAISMFRIFKRDRRGLTPFFAVVFVAIILEASDEILMYLENSGVGFPYASIINSAVFPLIAVWVVYFSDVKDYFNEEKRTNHE